MKIGVIVYSQTGNTYLVATKLKERLKSIGLTAEIKRIEVVRNQTNNIIEFKKIPDVRDFDVIVLGSPVEAFSLCPVMKQYLNNEADLSNKKVFCYVTQFFPYPWMGGNRAVRQIKKICKMRNAQICDSGVVNWKNKFREDIIKKIVNKFSDEIKGLK